ncbi:MAG: hypothetical protein K2H87_05525, partial [Duncaniella sp.]|nr:hypothetical protein [Duncaniella sp.]
MRSLTLLLILLLAGPAVRAATPLEAAARRIGEVRAGYHDPDSLRAAMASRPLLPAEGLWEFTGHGSTVAVELLSSHPDIYGVTLVYASDLSLLPGTLLGCLTPMAEAGWFDARLMRELSPSPRSLPRHSTFTLRLSADGAYMRIEPYGDTVKLDWWRLLIPSRRRNPLVRHGHDRPDATGFRRLYPEPDPPLY